MEVRTIIMEYPPHIKSISSANANKESLNSIVNEAILTDAYQTNDDLFKNLRGLLIFGRFIGVLPYGGVLSRSSSNLNFRWLSVPSLTTYSILSVLTLNAVFGFLLSVTSPKKNAFEVAQSVRSTLYYMWGAAIYLNFVVRSVPFLNIFQAWRSTIIFYTKPDKTMKRDTIIIALLILVSATLENGVLNLHMVHGILDDPSVNTTFLEAFYTRHQHSWNHFIGYHPFLAVLTFVQHKWILFAWNFIEVLIPVMGRALYFKFKALYEQSLEILVKSVEEKPIFSGNKKDTDSFKRQGWLQLTKDHRAICDLLQEFENFLSPLIFVSYMINIYYICMQLADGLMTADADRGPFLKVYVVWSFLHLIMRIYIVSICCARVNHYAHEIGQVIRHCPAECYSIDVSRLDKRVTSGRDIGLTGLASFIVTKPFILTTIGVIFTFEIVLLQVHPNVNGNNLKSCSVPIK